MLMADHFALVKFGLNPNWQQVRIIAQSSKHYTLLRKVGRGWTRPITINKKRVKAIL